jgi:hypothetical protein
MRSAIYMAFLLLITGYPSYGQSKAAGVKRLSPASPIYLIAATPLQSGSPLTYPAALYGVSGKGKLLLIRQLFTADQYFRDIGDDLDGKMYVAGQNGVFVIHQDDPTREDYVPFENYDDFPCWGVVRGEQLPSAMQYCFTCQLMKVLGDAQPGKPRVGPGEWAAFKLLQYEGEIGGPFQIQPPLAQIAGVNLVMPYSFRPNVVIAELPHEFETPASKRVTVDIVASTDRYLVLWCLLNSMAGQGSIDASNPPHIEPLQLLVLHRPTGRWQKLELPTAVTSNTHPPVRIFGDWLVTTIMEWRPGPHTSGAPVTEHGRPLPNELPVVREYVNQFVNLHIPGKLVLQNLSDGGKLTLSTGQDDSEIIAIRTDGEMLYRVNDSIYSAEIVPRSIATGPNGDRVTDSRLIVRDVDVAQVHWAFWGPATKSRKTVTNQRRSD